MKEGFISADCTQFDCHSSSLLEISSGELICVWKGGPGEGLSNRDLKVDVGLWMVRSQNGGWSEPEQILPAPDSVCCSPVLCKLASGEILLFCRIGPDPRHVTTAVIRSSDEGRSWSAPHYLPADYLGPTKSKPIIDR